MTPLLLAPFGLAALAALIVPLLVHLRRRTEEVPLDFAAMRWLEALPRPRRRIRFDELLLLALRLLLVALLALLLAQPAALGWEDKSARVLVAPGVDAAAARTAAGTETEAHWIAPGFPALANAPPQGPVLLSSLIRQFDAELPQGAPLTILVPPVLGGVDAERLKLTRKVTWRTLAAAPGAAGAQPAPAPALAVRYAEGRTAAPLRYFRAAAAAWEATATFTAEAGDTLPPRGSVLVWLHPGPVPSNVTDWVEAGGTALLASTAEIAMPAASGPLWADAGGNTLVEGGPLGTGRVMRFTRPLEPAVMPDLLDPGFPAALRDLVSPLAPPPARVVAAAASPASGAAPYPLPPRELSAWLAVLIALVFLAERMLASRARRFAA
ncbi:BatA domain-containing protein [Erythrobacter sp. CCH5-A1]|uniref:BatA domain-containing protein n=1 Tax=Erythrobacter sp. CCH5-A1 TaxID=1768792 RepID=UPI0008324E64|nr:BatA domain-containing protein [Erythrobacter sp. CCH5-A1]